MRWNSTYDMLSFALEYEKAVKRMTQTWDLALRTYELSPKEWKLAQQLLCRKIQEPIVIGEQF